MNIIDWGPEPNEGHGIIGFYLYIKTQVSYQMHSIWRHHGTPDSVYDMSELQNNERPVDEVFNWEAWEWKNKDDDDEEEESSDKYESESDENENND